MFNLNVLNKKLFPVVLLSIVLIVYSLFFIFKWSRNDTIFVGDTLLSFAVYSYQYSGIERGEHAIWNPLVRAGESEETMYAFQSASPLSSIVTAIFTLCGAKDIIFSFAIYILILILLYALGVYLLMSCWTDNRYAGALASILAIGSSSVFFYAYHLSFIQVLHAIPWILYAVMMYFRKFKFRYLIIFVLACTSAFYAYMFVKGLSYIIMLLVVVAVFYYKQAQTNFYKLRKIPAWHILITGSILFVVSYPVILMYLGFREQLAISRITDVSVTDNYTLIWQDAFRRITTFPLFSLKFWTTLFAGIFIDSAQELRHYVGPLVLPLAAVALFSWRKLAWGIALSGLFIMMLAGNVFPANLLYKLPVFLYIRNAHFLLQFVIFALIILAGFGFDCIIKGKSRKVFLIVCVPMLLISLLMLFFKVNESIHNNTALLILIGSLLIVLLAMICLPLKWFAGVFLGIAAVGMFGGTLLVNHLPLAGATNVSPELMALRQRSDHSLGFRFQRPLDIDKVNWMDSYDTTLGRDEFLSFVTLKDNSFKTLGGSFGISSYPLTKRYFLFTSLPGYEEIMKRKFLFFSKCYLSPEAVDMMEFIHNPNLLLKMVQSGVGMVNQVNSSDVSLGPFRSRDSEDIGVVAAGAEFCVDVKKYNTNSILLDVSVDKKGVLTYTDLWDKGWMVKVDSEFVPLLKVFHTFKGVELSAGRHQIEFLYKNKIITAIVVMNITFVVCFLSLVLNLLCSAWHNRLTNRR